MFMFLASSVGALYVALVIVALHYFRSDVSVLSGPISQYAIGRHGRWMTSALFVWAAAALTFAAGIYGAVELSVYVVVSMVLLVAFALGLAVAAIFPMDLPFPPKRFHPSEFSRSGLLHINGATLSTLTFPVAAFLLSAGFGEDQRWQHLATPALGLATVSAVATAVFFVVSMVWVHLFGLAQRLFVAADLVWLFTLSSAFLAA